MKEVRDEERKIFQVRPSAHLTTEGKQRWARTVLRWEADWELLVPIA